MVERLVEQAVNKAHGHPRELHATAVQQVEHHFYSGRVGLQAVFFRDADVNLVAAVGNLVKTQVLINLFHLNLLTRLVHIEVEEDRKSTRLNSSHVRISYAVFCLKKKTCVY